MHTLLACCGALPSHVKHMVPTFREVLRRGWNLWLAVEGPVVGPYLISQGFRPDRLLQTGGVWQGHVLKMPQADWLFNKTKPDAVIVSHSGHGYPGGAWLDEVYQRGVPAVEFLNTCYPLVWWYGSKQHHLLGQYVEALREVGYGLEMHKCLCGTEAQQWVGLPIGDRLFEHVSPSSHSQQSDLPVQSTACVTLPTAGASPMELGHTPQAAGGGRVTIAPDSRAIVSRKDTCVKLGLEPDQEYVLVSPPWTKDEQRAAELSANLKQWSKMAQEHGKVLVMSLHPNARYATPMNAAVKIPPEVVCASCWPGEIWGRPIRACPTMPLIRHAAFVIHTYRTGHVHLCIAAKATMWSQHMMMHAHSRKWTEEDLAQVIGNGPRPPTSDESWTWFWNQEALVRFRARQQTEEDLRQIRPYFNLPCYYRGQADLAALFAGELRGYKGGEEAWESMSEEYRLKVDGKVAERIVDLIER